LNIFRHLYLRDCFIECFLIDYTDIAFSWGWHLRLFDWHELSLQMLRFIAITPLLHCRRYFVSLYFFCFFFQVYAPSMLSTLSPPFSPFLSFSFRISPLPPLFHIFFIILRQFLPDAFFDSHRPRHLLLRRLIFSAAEMRRAAPFHWYAPRITVYILLRQSGAIDFRDFRRRQFSFSLRCRYYYIAASCAMWCRFSIFERWPSVIFYFFEIFFILFMLLPLFLPLSLFSYHTPTLLFLSSSF